MNAAGFGGALPPYGAQAQAQYNPYSAAAFPGQQAYGGEQNVYNGGDMSGANPYGQAPQGGAGGAYGQGGNNGYVDYTGGFPGAGQGFPGQQQNGFGGMQGGMQAGGMPGQYGLGGAGGYGAGFNGGGGGMQGMQNGMKGGGGGAPAGGMAQGGFGGGGAKGNPKGGKGGMPNAGQGGDFGGGGGFGGGYGGGYANGNNMGYGGGYGGYGDMRGMGMNLTDFDAEFGGEEGGAGYEWQEYSKGNVPEYQAEALWSGTVEAASVLTVEEEKPTEEDLEVHVFGPGGETVPPALTTFELAAQVFPQQLMQQFYTQGFVRPTPIQAHTWAVASSGRDVIGVAKTGSGKTLAYLLPGFLKIINNRCAPPAIIVLSPTRELAIQIEQEAERFGRPIGIRTACCYGGAPRGPQLGQLRRGAQIIVACPGRLNDFITCGMARCNTCQYFVLDEADRMLDMGFEPRFARSASRPPQRRGRPSSSPQLGPRRSALWPASS